MLILKFIMSLNLLTPCTFAPFSLGIGTTSARYNLCSKFKLCDNNGYTFLCSMFLSWTSITFVPGWHHNRLTMPAPCAANTCDASAKVFIWSFILRFSRATVSQPLSFNNSSSELIILLVLAPGLKTTIFLCGFTPFKFFNPLKCLSHGAIGGTVIPSCVLLALGTIKCLNCHVSFLGMTIIFTSGKRALQ